tara:strand:- start:271450 stop:271749 length:300 start_codon:yes stop_codon:yes gene_type:complete
MTRTKQIDGINGRDNNHLPTVGPEGIDRPMGIADASGGVVLGGNGKVEVDTVIYSGPACTGADILQPSTFIYAGIARLRCLHRKRYSGSNAGETSSSEV